LGKPLMTAQKWLFAFQWAVPLLEKRLLERKQ
jgi:hypothetical protein